MFPMEPAHFQNAAVATDDKRCSEMGKSILLKGGSAVDSAITVQLCIEAVNSHSTGITGGGFMIIYDKKSGVCLINFLLGRSLDLSVYVCKTFTHLC